MPIETLMTTPHTAFLIFELGLAIAVVIYLHSSTISLWRGAPFVPTRTKAIGQILKMTNPQSGMKFLELGCGDGRMVCQAVKEFDITGQGVDVSRLWLWIASIRAWRLGIGNRVEFKHQNILQTDLSSADIIYIYMMPRFLDSYGEIFHKAIEEGALVISHTFEIKALQRYEQSVVSHGNCFTYFYKQS